MEYINTGKDKLDELKKMMRLYEVVKLKEPIDIKVRQFNFRTGCADTLLDMTVKFVGKVPYGSGRPEEFLDHQIMVVYGIKRYSSGNEYTGSTKLTYTDDEELQKVIDMVKESDSPRPNNEYFDALRGYVN
jgi:hypothetical protein